uniref:Uncharacterized protein n=1 Tax=Arion vulgaris TaxID=1028688 RepID=A0A0B6ZL41_9EUPU
MLQKELQIKENKESKKMKLENKNKKIEDGNDTMGSRRALWKEASLQIGE